MKKALLFVVLLILVGFVGFLYRNTLEAPTHGTNATSTQGGMTVCTLDAKICPDGSAVGRTGADCHFAACPAPNIEIASASIGFALPTGFKENKAAYGSDISLIGAYEKTGTTSPADSIIVRRYPIPEGEDANSVMLANTTYESSGMQPTSMGDFKPVIINGKTYQTVTVERFEAVVHVVYYLPRENDVLRFEAIQHNVTNWTDSSLNIRSLSTVAALEHLLTTLQTP